MESNEEMYVKRNIKTICIPMEMIYEALVKVELIKSKQEKRKREK